MKFIRPVVGAFLLAAGHLALLELAVLMQSVPYLFWPSLALRFVLLVAGAVPLGLQGLVAIKWGVHSQPIVVFFLFHLGLLFLFSRVRALLAVARSETVVSRRMLMAGTGVVALGSMGLLREARDLVIKKHSLALKQLPAELEGLRVVLLADLHRGPAVSQAYLLEVVERVNQLKPDIILMPGDFVSKSRIYFADLAEGLSHLNPRLASFATLGNHDHWEGADEALQALEKAGVIHLQNRHLYLNRHLEVVPHSRAGLCFAGVDDYWNGMPNSDHLEYVEPNVPVIFLSHNPDVCEVEKTRRHRIDFQVSGHTHGGQVVLPALGPVATASSHGTKYLYGLNQGPDWPVYTTSGIGTSTVPVRMGTKPEIVLFELETLS